VRPLDERRDAAGGVVAAEQHVVYDSREQRAARGEDLEAGERHRLFLPTRPPSETPYSGKRQIERREDVRLDREVAEEVRDVGRNMRAGGGGVGANIRKIMGEQVDHARGSRDRRDRTHDRPDENKTRAGLFVGSHPNMLSMTTDGGGEAENSWCSYA